MNADADKRTSIILAGGMGTRLRSAVPDRPKCLAPVNGIPFLEIQIQSLLEAGVERIVLSLGFGADLVIKAFKDVRWNGLVNYVVEPEPLGTGGAIAFAMDHYSLDHALVANGDTFLEGDIRPMFAKPDLNKKDLLTISIVHVEDCGRYGSVDLGQDGKVSGFNEKGCSGGGWINAGLYHIERSALPIRKGTVASFETEIMPALVNRGAVSAIKINGSFIDIGTPEDYQKFCKAHAA